MTISTVPRRVPFSRRAAELERAPISWLMAQALEVPGLLSLAAGFVDQETLPAAEMVEIAAAVLGDEKSGRDALQYGTTAGDPELRRVLLDRMASDRSPIWSQVGIEDVVLTSGSQQLLYLLAEVLLEDGDIVLVEDPSYFVFMAALESLSTRLVGVECDADGVRPEALDRCLEELHRRGDLGRVKLVYLMTYFQNPTGASLSAERGPRVLQVMRDWQERGLEALVLEDAAYRDLCFPGEAEVPPLFEGQDANETVCYAGSFSKSLAPGLRLGYGIVPTELAETLVRLKSHHDFGTGNLSQQLVLKALQTGMIDSHVEKMRRRYLGKCELLFEVLRAELGDAIELEVPRGGLYLWGRLPEGLDTGLQSRVFARALEEKVLYVPGEICCVNEASPDDPTCRSMRLCYSYPPDEELAEAGRRLARAIASVV